VCAPSRAHWERLWRAPDSDSPRLDYREGADAERVLMLHELQSDWMQSARRGLREQENGAHVACTPCTGCASARPRAAILEQGFTAWG